MTIAPHTSHLNRKALLGASLLALLTTPALADTATATATSTAADTGTVEPLIVTAQRRVEDNLRVPVAITVLGPNQIQNITAGYLTDIGIKTPNVFMTQGTISPTISIRGVSSQSNVNAGFPPAVGVYIDEVYQGRDPTFNTILNDVERVEVLRGPQGTLYGKNTIGGAINIVTTAPTNEVIGFGDITYGNRNLFQARATVGGGLIPDLLMVRFSYAHRQIDGFLQNTLTGQTLNGNKADGARLVVQSNPTPNIKIRLGGDYFKQNGTDALETDPLVTPAPVPARIAALLPQNASDNIVQLNSPEDFRRKLYGVMGRVDVGLGFADFTSITSARKYTSFFDDDSDGTSLDAFNVGREEDAKSFSQELRLTSAGKGPITWIIGGYYYSEDIANTRLIHLGPDMPQVLLGAAIPGLTGESASTVSSINSKSYAVFASATWQITQGLRLAGGIRWTKETKDFLYHQFYTQTFANLPNGLLISNFAVAIPLTHETYNDSRPTGDVSLSYDFTDAFTTYVKYSRGYKAGGFQTDVISPPFSPTDRLGFDPEFVNNYEGGIKSYWFDHKVSLNLAVFYLQWTNKQEQIFTGLSFLIRNAATASSRGAELEFTARPTRYLTIDANAAYLDAKYDSFPATPALSGQPFQGTPRFSGSIGAQYVAPLMDGMDLFARVDGIYRDSVYYLNNVSTKVTLPSVQTINLRVGIQAADSKWGIYFWSKDLNNQVILGSGSTFPFPKATITTRTAGYGRTYGIELRDRF